MIGDDGSYIRLISTHAPARGATEDLLPVLLEHFDFNSRTRVGRDKCNCLLSFSVCHFNSHTRVGCDPGKINGTITSVYFNSRTRVGCDRDYEKCAWIYQNFNSRTREGCDQEQKIYPLQNTLFQLTHPRGVRQQKQTKISICFCSFFAQLTK